MILLSTSDNALSPSLPLIFPHHEQLPFERTETAVAAVAAAVFEYDPCSSLVARSHAASRVECIIRKARLLASRYDRNRVPYMH